MNKGVLFLLGVWLIIPAICLGEISFPGTFNSTILWKINGPVEQYPGKKLYEYIDGGADIYFDYGFKTCNAARYSSPDIKGLEIEINVYDLEKPTHAFGLFRELSAYDTVKSNPGVEGIVTDNYIYFWKGRYYVVLNNKSSAKLSRQNFLTIAQQFSKQVPGDNSLPDILTWFPKKEKQAGSERYFKANFLSRSFLSNVVSATYKLKNTTFELFILSAESDSSAQIILGKIRKDFEAVKDEKNKSSLKKFPHVIAKELVVIRNSSRITGISGISDLLVIQSLILECIDLQK